MLNGTFEFFSNQETTLATTMEDISMKKTMMDDVMMESHLQLEDRASESPLQGMASDWGQNRSLHFVSSELLNPVEHCSSRRHVTLFVSSCSTFRRNLA